MIIRQQQTQCPTLVQYHYNVNYIHAHVEAHVNIINPLTPNVAIWQHTYFRHHNLIKK